MSGPASDALVPRLRRRAITLPLVTLACFLILVLWLPLALLSLVIGLIRRRRFALLRTVSLAAAYAVLELWGLAALAAVWVISGFGLAPAARQRMAFWVQRQWLRGLWWAARRCLGLRVELDGEAIPDGPILVFARHTSMLDVLIPGNYVLAPRRSLRWVLKKELLVEPCLDIAGHWMPNHFVDRSGQHSQAELAAIEQLARGLRDEEGAIIFPEGTRFSQARRQRVIERLAERDAELASYAESLAHLLAPRVGGSQALMRGAPEARVVFLGHRGLEGSRSWAQLLSGELVGRELSIRMWTAPRPEAEDGVEPWLRTHWTDMDAWIETQATRAPPGS